MSTLAYAAISNTMQGDVARIMLSYFVLFCGWPLQDDCVEGSQGLPAKQKVLIGS